LSVCGLVKSYTGLAAAATEDGQGREYALWLVLRHVDGQGAGWVALGALRGFCAESGYLSGRSLRRILARGEGSYWTVNDWAQRVEYRSLGRVALRLRASPELSLLVPLDKLRGRGIRAVGLAGFLKPREDRGTTVAVIAQVTGLNARAQHRCRERLGIEKRQNVGNRGKHKRGRVYGVKPGELAPREWVFRGQVYRWLACSWRVPFGVVTDSHARRVGKAVRGAVGKTGDGDRVERLYFDSLESARKERNRGPLAWVRRERQDGKAVVWDAN